LRRRRGLWTPNLKRDTKGSVRAALLRSLPSIAVLAVATTLLTWGLGAVYLWQDEAATAVLAERMLRFGRPLAYDGRNLITMDSFSDEDAATIDERAGSTSAEIDYLVKRRDFKPDGTWIGQPWGQFAAAALSLSLLGHGTAAARLPFAVAGILTALLLYALARRLFEDRAVALLAAALLLSNALWIVHARQCRYYAFSSLLLLASVAAFSRWQRGAKWSTALFIAVAWLYFQFDFGSFFPAMGVLFAIAIARDWRRPTRPLLTFAVLGALVAPFALFYEIGGRLRTPTTSLGVRFLLTSAKVNQYVIAFPLLLLAGWLVWHRRGPVPRRTMEVLVACLLVICALMIWVPLVAPYPFHRYVVQATPLAALLLAWAMCDVARTIVSSTRRPWLRMPFLAGAFATIAFTGTFSVPATFAFLQEYPDPIVRPEVTGLLRETFRGRPDPNRDVIERLAPLLRPGDEILVNYEDIPFMFYTDARVRGGVAAFRVEDRTAPPPRFLVLRRTVPFVHWPVFARERDRYLWRELATDAPDLPFGNNPDPTFFPLPTSPYRVFVAERVGP